MNIQDAARYMELGYRARRQSDVPLIFGRYGGENWIDDEHIISLTIDDLLADDWEVVFDGIVNDDSYVVYEDQ
jgi:hypothetical protein